MKNYTKDKLQEAIRAIDSMIGKIQKVAAKETLGPSQKTLIERRLKALQIASELVAIKLEEME